MRETTRSRSPRVEVAAGAVTLCLIAALAAGCAGTRPAGGDAAGPEAVVPEDPIRAEPEGGEPEGAEPEGADSEAGGPLPAEPMPGDPAPEGAAGAEPTRPLPEGAPLPDTVAGRTLGEWLAIYNRGTETEIESFIGTRFAPEFLAQLPVPALVAFHLQTRETTGELVPVEIQSDGEHSLRALAGGTGGTAGGAVMITLAVEPDPPHRITGLRLVSPGS